MGAIPSIRVVFCHYRHRYIFQVWICLCCLQFQQHYYPWTYRITFITMSLPNEQYFIAKKKGNGFRPLEFPVLIMFPIGCMYLAYRGVTQHAPSGPWHYLFDNDLVVGMSSYTMQVSLLHSQESTDLGTQGWKCSVPFHYQLITLWTHFGFCPHDNELGGFRSLNA